MVDVRFGIDIGGTGIKGAKVDVNRGVLVSERMRIPTPHPASPRTVAPVVGELVRAAAYSGSVGCAFPAVVKDGIAQTAANVDASWIGTSVCDVLSEELGGAPVVAVNDADSAGIAELHFGAGRDVRGLVVMLTIGTGIGSAVFIDGILVPNTELGHLEVDGHEAERRASETAREEHNLSRKEWADRFNRYLEALEALLWPDLVILGGGVSKAPEKFMPLLTSKARLVPAELANVAGIIGAALAAS
ncbi:MAG TPA: ROK family protein [Mycobacteriales bacterium]|nr:ROK family protein [Mycobacteriales bacterium]